MREPTAFDTMFTVLASYPAYHYRGRVERVIDGDTLKVVLDLGFNVTVSTSLRLHGINCPEIRTPEGVAAKVYVLDTLGMTGGEITATIKGPDKYGGRWLAVVYCNGVSLNELLVAAGMAAVSTREVSNAPHPTEGQPGGT